MWIFLEVNEHSEMRALTADASQQRAIGTEQEVIVITQLSGGIVHKGASFFPIRISYEEAQCSGRYCNGLDIRKDQRKITLRILELRPISILEYDTRLC
jgi:hypothetical protein